MTVLKSLAVLVRQWEIAFGEKPAEIAMHPYLVHQFMIELPITTSEKVEIPPELLAPPGMVVTYAGIPIRPDHNCPFDRIYLAQKIDIPPPEVF